MAPDTWYVNAGEYMGFGSIVGSEYLVLPCVTIAPRVMYYDRGACTVKRTNYSA